MLRGADGNGTQSHQKVREGVFWLWASCSRWGTRQQLRQVNGCFTRRHLHPPSPPAALIQAPFLSLSQLYNVGVGWRSWESSIPCSPRSLVASSPGPPQLLHGERRERSARETPGLKLSKTTGLESNLAAITGTLPQPQQGQDLRLRLPTATPSRASLGRGLCPVLPVSAAGRSSDG